MTHKFWLNPEDTIGYAACDNPNCPLHPKNGGEPNHRHRTYQNGRTTLCEVCIEEVR